MDARRTLGIFALLLATAGCTDPELELDEGLCDCLMAEDASNCGPVICSIEAECGDYPDFSFTKCPKPVVASAAELACALEALRDRTPGVIEFDISHVAGYASLSGYIVILANGHVITYAEEREDLGRFRESCGLAMSGLIS